MELLSKDDLIRIRETSKKKLQDKPTRRNEIDWMIMDLVTNGIRPMQVCNLRIADIAVIEKNILVSSGSRQTRIPISNELRQHLSNFVIQKIQRNETSAYESDKCGDVPFDAADLLFTDNQGQPLTLKSVESTIMRALKESGYRGYKPKHVRFGFEYCLQQAMLNELNSFWNQDSNKIRRLKLF